MKRLLIPLLTVLLFSNCARILQKKPLSTEDITVQEIRNRVEQNFWKLSSIKGSAHLSVEMPGMGFTALSNIVLKMPDSLFMNVKAGFGMGVGSIFVDKNRFAVYSSMENKVYYGDINSFDLNQFFQVNVKFNELFALISGTPIIDETEHSSLSIDESKYLITIKTDQGIKKYWIDPKKFVVTNIHLYDDKEELIVKHEFQKFYKERGVYLPKIIRVNRPKGNERVTLMYTDRKTNSGIKPKDFSIKIPDNTQIINL